jgi:ketosteroid isomerase-like protein
VNNRELVLSYLNAFKTGDPEVVAKHVSDDFENIQVGVLGTGCKGRKTYCQRLEKFLKDFVDLEYHIELLIVEDSAVAARYRMTFSQSDKQIEIPGVMIFEISDDQIAVRRDYWDGMSYELQTGN